MNCEWRAGRLKVVCAVAAVDLAFNLLQRCYGMPFVKQQHPNRMAVAQRTANGGLPPPCLAVPSVPAHLKQTADPEAEWGGALQQPRLSEASANGIMIRRGVITDMGK